MEHKSQHWVPMSYLAAWIDPDTPPNQTGFVWVFNKNGGSPKKKAPKNIFEEADFYTKAADDGSRDLTLEKKLSSIEKNFISVRRNKLDLHLGLTLEDQAKIIAFSSTMSRRTKLCRDHEKAQWGYVLKVMNSMAASIKRNPSAVFSPSLQPHDHTNSMSHEDVRKTANEPIQSTLLVSSMVTAEALAKMDRHILCAPENSSFITSDHPCISFDPTGKYTALGCPDIQVTLPISPKQMLIFFWGGRRRLPQYAYMQASKTDVDGLNQNTRSRCHEHFIANNKTALAPN